MLINPSQSCFLLIDMQTRLWPVVAEPQAISRNSQILLKAIRRLGIPTLVSQQYTRGLGPTIDQLTALISNDEIVEKTSFSCMKEEAYLQRFRALERDQAVVAGIEAHVCVLQTVENLLDDGRHVFVVADAISSRTHANYLAAVERMRASGATIVTTEMVIFEWMQTANTPEFRELSALIK